MSASVTRRLNDGVGALETMSRFALATLALASGVYTYLGVRGLLDGTATIVFFAAIIYSVAVSVGIYAFWTYMLRLFPHVATAGARAALTGVMALGCVMIIAMSSWLNAAALAGSAALEQHLAETLQDYTGNLSQAHENALAAQSLLPDIQRAQERFARLADDERATGALTGTSGSGSVVQLLSQMSAQLGELETNIIASRGRVQELFDAGQVHLGTMRGLVSGSGAIEPRADQFAEQVVQLAGVIGAMEQTSVAPSVKRAADDLSLGFIAPVASGAAADLATRQTAVMDTIRASVAAQSGVLSQAAEEILAQPPVDSRRFVPLSSAEAVLRYAGDFIPSWAGAISIDLLPAVLILILTVVQSVLRAEESRVPFARRISAEDLLQAIAFQQELAASTNAGRTNAADTDAEIAHPPTAEGEATSRAEPPPLSADGPSEARPRGERVNDARPEEAPARIMPLAGTMAGTMTRPRSIDGQS